MVYSSVVLSGVYVKWGRNGCVKGCLMWFGRWGCGVVDVGGYGLEV